MSASTILSSSLIVASLACLGCSQNAPQASVQQKSSNQSELHSVSAKDGDEPKVEPLATETERNVADLESSKFDSEPLGYDQICEKLRQHALPAILIEPSVFPPKTPWQSCIGGVPYWLKGKALPISPSGAPLYLLAQINFSETPQIPGYPTEGILQVFITEDDLYGLEIASEKRTQEDINKHPHGYQLVYHPQPEQEISRLLTEAPVAKTFPVTGSYALTFKKVQDPVGARDRRFEKLIARSEEIPEDVLEKLWEDYSGDGSKLGGYAHFTQEDPRPEDTAAEWILLLQIDSVYSDDISIMWGDVGVANIFIRPKDLAKKNFSNVWYNWDCY